MFGKMSNRLGDWEASVSRLKMVMGVALLVPVGAVLAAENLLVNPGFEEATCPAASNAGQWGWFKDGQIAVAGWRGSGNAGIAKAGNDTWKTAGTGTWTALVQRYRPWGAGLNSFIEQTVHLEKRGTYEFSFALAKREGFGPGWVALSVDDGAATTEVGAVEYREKAYRRVVFRMNLTGGKDYTFRLHALEGIDNDTTALIDDCVLGFCGVHEPPVKAGTLTLQVTDLFRPHGDPDDHWDLVTQYALAKTGAIDLKGVIGDFPPTSLASRTKCEPEVTGVAQMNWITSLAVPMGVGQPRRGMAAQSGFALLKQTLEAAKEPVVIHVVGTCADVAEAASRWPDLFRTKVRAVYLNAGAAVESKHLEYNVQLDPKPYADMFKLPCPVYWMPCFQTTVKPGRNGTYFRFKMSRCFERMRPAMQNFFVGVFERRNPGDWLSSLERPVDEAALAKYGAMMRNMWCTAGFLHAAGMTVWKDGTIAPLGKEPAREVFRFIPVDVTCSAEGRTEWKPSTQSNQRFIFQVEDESAYPEAMARALAEMMFWL